MKKIIAIAILCFSFGMFANAQKYACVNTEYILSSIPDYAAVETQLNQMATNWQKELESKFAEIDKMYKSYQQEAYLLPDNLKRKREEEIVNKEKEVKELQRKRFGSGGDLDKKREELMRPIQEKVYNAIERIANEKSYAFVFDRAKNNTVLFANAKYDISDQVLDLLGYSKLQAPAEGASAGKSNAPAAKRSVNNAELKKPY